MGLLRKFISNDWQNIYSSAARECENDACGHWTEAFWLYTKCEVLTLISISPCYIFLLFLLFLFFLQNYGAAINVVSTMYSRVVHLPPTPDRGFLFLKTKNLYSFFKISKKKHLADLVQTLVDYINDELRMHAVQSKTTPGLLLLYIYNYFFDIFSSPLLAFVLQSFDILRGLGIFFLAFHSGNFIFARNVFLIIISLLINS